MSLPSVLPGQPRGSWSRLRSSGLFLLVFLALPLTVSCGAARSSAMRSNSAEREGRIVLTRRPRPAVQVNRAAFEMTMAMLAADVHAPRGPFEGRLVLAAWQPQAGIERELADGFRQWCGWKQSSAAQSGCESILEDDGRWLGLDTREAMAFASAMSSVGDGAVEAVKGMVDPVAFKAMLYTALAICMALLVLPEPTSKALVVAITVGLCTYLGWSSIWGILQGWKRLSAAAKAARTFDELSAAGERFGKLLGANTARVMVMVATTALGSTGGTAWASAGARLPGWGQALQLATAEGLAPALAAPAASVMVAGETLTIGLAAGSNMAMAATQPQESGTASGIEPRLPWRSWEEYEKVILGGREYAKIGDRLYTRHAVARMQPRGLNGLAPGTDPGRSISPTFVEDVIRRGAQQKVHVNGIERTNHTSGTVQVITEQNGMIVITVNPFSGTP